MKRKTIVINIVPILLYFIDKEGIPIFNIFNRTFFLLLSICSVLHNLARKNPKYLNKEKAHRSSLNCYSDTAFPNEGKPISNYRFSLPAKYHECMARLPKDMIFARDDNP